VEQKITKRKKSEIRREFLKLKLNGLTYKECQKDIENRYERKFAIRTLKRWKSKFEVGDWDLLDKSTVPNKLNFKVSLENEIRVVSLREITGWGSYKIRMKLAKKEIYMPLTTIERIIRKYDLSRGSPMQGKRYKYVRFQREHPNSMLQIDGTEDENGNWIVPVIDDCSRYCLSIGFFEHNTEENMIKLLEEVIQKHGKPREILTDNGCEFGGTGKNNNEFDRWCEKQGIKHIRSRIHKPTTVGKVSKIQQTLQQELPYCHNDLEYFRYRYNHERPHMSLDGLTPAEVYFAFHKLF